LEFELDHELIQVYRQDFLGVDDSSVTNQSRMEPLAEVAAVPSPMVVLAPAPWGLALLAHDRLRRE
jgi:hypothetical protein